MKPIKRRNNKRTGALMIEVLFAVFVAGICALIYSAAMPVANKSRAKADYMNIATGLAQKELEALKSVDASLNPVTLAANGLIDSATQVSPNKYLFTNSDTAVSDSPAKTLPSGKGYVTIETIDIELRRVTVQVNWKEMGSDRSIKVATLVAKLDN